MAVICWCGGGCFELGRKEGLLYTHVLICLLCLQDKALSIV